jgi:hypothetical protein
MATQRKTDSSRSIRQSVTIPATLIGAVRRSAEEQLGTQYSRFLDENDPALTSEAGKDLIRKVFGTDAIAKDPIR